MTNVPRSALRFAAHGGDQDAVQLGPRDAQVVVGIAPALGVRSDYYLPLAEAVVSAGQGALGALVVDPPGHGKSTLRAGRHSDWGYREVLAHFAALRQAAREAGARRFVWLGHSLGGQVALMDGEHADGVVLIASGTPYHRCWPGLAGLRVLALTQLSLPIAAIRGHYPGKSLGFGGREARTLMANWAHAARTGEYRFDGLDGDAAIARARCAIHAVTVEGDALAPAAATDHVLTKASAARVTRSLWRRDEQGELARGNQHNRWPRFPAVPVRELLGLLSREQLISPAVAASR